VKKYPIIPQKLTSEWVRDRVAFGVVGEEGVN